MAEDSEQTPTPEPSTPETAGSETPPVKKRWVRPEIRYTLSAIVLLFVFEYLLLPEIASARHNIHILAHANYLLLGIAIVLEVGALLAYTELSRTVFAPDPPNHWTMLRINMSGLAISHVVPGGTAAGGAVGYRLLSEQGVPGTTAAFGMATQGVGSAVVLNIIFWLSLLISIPLNGVNRLYGYAALAGVLLLAAFAGTVLLLTRGQRHADNWMRRLATHLPFITPDKISELLRHDLVFKPQALGVGVLLGRA